MCSSDLKDQKESAVANDWKAAKEQQALERKRENELKKLEEHITELETAIEELNANMALPENATNVAALQSMNKELTALQTELDETYEKWEQLA